ncbi:MAG: hypothetical protein ACFHWX_20985 [Bacteroidota bacterium]
MKGLLIVICGLGCLVGVAQTTFTEKVSVNSQELVQIDFPFTDEIIIKTWDEQEVSVEAKVTINDGEDDQMFAIGKSSSSSEIRVFMDEEPWKSNEKKRNNWSTEIFITVYVPKSLDVRAKTISGNIVSDYFGKSLDLKTISGDIDLTILPNSGLDFKAKTISGDIFSDLEVQFPNGKDGLRKIVGMDLEGRIRNGGEKSHFETISGNVFLRKG